MPVIFYDIEKQNSTQREPYSTFARRFKAISHDLDGQIIELRIGAGKEGFGRGFYTDSQFTNHASLRFFFAKGQERSVGGPTFVRMEFSFERNDCNSCFYQHHINLLKKRVPYFYIPHVSHLEFSAQIDEDFKLHFDVVSEEESTLQEVCFCLINQMIAIFSFED